MYDVWERTKTWLTAEFNFNEDRGQKLKLIYKDEILDNEQSLEQAGITTDSKLFVQVEHEDEEAER